MTKSNIHVNFVVGTVVAIGALWMVFMLLPEDIPAKYRYIIMFMVCISLSLIMGFTYMYHGTDIKEKVQEE